MIGDTARFPFFRQLLAFSVHMFWFPLRGASLAGLKCAKDPYLDLVPVSRLFVELSIVIRRNTRLCAFLRRRNPSVRHVRQGGWRRGPPASDGGSNTGGPLETSLTLLL